MGGKRKRVLLKPTASRARPPANLPTRYDFEPRSTSQTVPPVLPKNTRQPSVKDYPPPKQLFQTSAAPQSRASPVVQPQPSPVAHSTAPASSANLAAPTAPPSGQIIGAQTRAPAYSGNRAATSQSSQQQQRSQTPPFQQSQAPPFQPSQSSPFEAAPSPPPRATQSHHSSQAQNEAMAEEDGNLSDGEAPIEPNLSEDQMQAMNSLLLAPRPKQITILDPDLTEPNSTWFGYDRSKLTRQITKIFTNKFDGPYYSWSCVPRQRQERYFVEFAKKHRWDPSLTGLVQEHFESIIQLRMKDMVSSTRSSDEQPKWITDDIWADMKLHWSTEEQIAKSATTSAARMSDRKGLGAHKHASGQKSYLQLEQEMIVEKGRAVTWGEVFIRAHTKKDGTFVDLKAQQVAEAYLKNRDAKMSELDAENTEISDGRHPKLSVEEDNELFIQSTVTNDRGDVFGIGSLKNQLKGKQVNPQKSSAFTQLQQQLQDAQRQIEEQAALIAQQEEEHARVAAAQKAQIADLSVVKKFLTTDKKFLAFLTKETASTNKPTVADPAA